MTKAPSWNAIRAAAASFAARWADDTDENKGAQSFWTEFLGIFGIDRKRVAIFEAPAVKGSTGGKGRIDLFWPGVLAVEHKSAGKDLDAAMQQCLDYLATVPQAAIPQAIVVSDFQRIRIKDLLADGSTFEFPLADLPKEIDRFGWLAGYTRRTLSAEQEQAVNLAAAALMGRMYQEVERAGYGEHETSVLLTRILFLLFGDDTGLWEKSLFQEFVLTRTAEDGSDLGPQLAFLFQILDKPVDQRPAHLDELVARFPYVNGGLFSDRLDIPIFDQGMRDELLACNAFDWGLLVPAIFGSLFQAVKSRAARRALGEHYTSEENILKVIGPLFLDTLRAEFRDVYNDVAKLKKLRAKLGTLTLADPSCGCGNFLVVAYRELRTLELDIMLRLRELTGENQLALDATLGLQVSPEQCIGIEIEEWPARIAEAAMFLVDAQCNIELSKAFGDAPERLPISTSATIIQGNALQLDWQQIVPVTDTTYIFGNPPYGGRKTRTATQTADLQAAFAGSKGSGNIDYVCAWFAKAADYIKGTRARVGFVATSSVTQGEQPDVLWKYLTPRGMGIDYAYRTFPWENAAPGKAAVHCVIIGFSDHTVAVPKVRWIHPAQKKNVEPGEPIRAANINPYLIDSTSGTVASSRRALDPATPPMVFGSMPNDAGYLCKIDGPEAERIRAEDPIAARYLRPLIGAEELINGGARYCLWLVDANPADILTSPTLRDRVNGVKTERAKSTRPATKALAATPTLFGEIRQPQTAYLAVPRHSSEDRVLVPMAKYDPEIIAMDALMIIPTADLYLFGLLQSSVFHAWNTTVSGRLESRIRISAEITYNNFPHPTPTDAQHAAVTDAAQQVLDVRDAFPDSTLGQLYNPIAMPPKLATAHSQLDCAVLTAYGLKPDATEEQILQHLFDRYETAITVGQLELETKKRKTSSRGRKILKVTETEG